jgi:hypothetical protein
LKGCFERYILKGQIAFEGHWRLQSSTLLHVDYVILRYSSLIYIHQPRCKEGRTIWSALCWLWVGYMLLGQCPGRFLGIINQDPSVSKSNWLHVNIFWFSSEESINFWYILYIPLEWSISLLKSNIIF